MSVNLHFDDLNSGLAVMLLQAACDYSNIQEAQLDSFSSNWTDQVADLHDQLQVALRERDEANQKLHQIYKATSDALHVKAEESFCESQYGTTRMPPKQSNAYGEKANPR